MNRAGFQFSRAKPTKHIPSGIIITWQGNDGKIHTQSIGLVRRYEIHTSQDTDGKRHIQSIPVGFNRYLTELNAKTELLFHQMDCWGVKGQVLPAPMITNGLTRGEAKIAYLKELGSQPQQYQLSTC